MSAEEPDLALALELAASTLRRGRHLYAGIMEIHVPNPGDVGQCLVCCTSWPCRTYNLLTDDLGDG